MTNSDVLTTHPTTCDACALHAPDRACIEHTCPDCAAITSGATNDAGELIHVCA